MAAKPRKTGGISPVTQGVEDPSDHTTISLQRSFQKIVKVVAANRPKKVSLKNRN
jgi:hypothetical protein